MDNERGVANYRRLLFEQEQAWTIRMAELEHLIRENKKAKKGLNNPPLHAELRRITKMKNRRDNLIKI